MKNGIDHNIGGASGGLGMDFQGLMNGLMGGLMRKFYTLEDLLGEARRRGMRFRTTIEIVPNYIKATTTVTKEGFG